MKILVIGLTLLSLACFLGLGMIAYAKADEAAAKAHNEYVEHYRATDPDVLACRARGAMPVFNWWTGQIEDCKALPVKQ